MKKTICVVMLLCMAGMLSGCKASDYKAAVALYDSGDYAAAAEAFSTISDYKDSAEKIDDCKYELGKKAFDEKDYKTCLSYFVQIPEHENVKESIHKILFDWITGDFQSHLTDGTNHFTAYVKSELSRLVSWASGIAYSGGSSTFNFNYNDSNLKALSSDLAHIRSDSDYINSLFDQNVLAVCDEAVKQALDKVNDVAKDASETFTQTNAQNYVMSAVPTSGKKVSAKSPEAFMLKISELESAANALK